MESLEKGLQLCENLWSWEAEGLTAVLAGGKGNRIPIDNSIVLVIFCKKIVLFINNIV